MLTSSTNADTPVGSIVRLIQSRAISLAAENKSPRTVGSWRAVEGHGDEDLGPGAPERASFDTTSARATWVRTPDTQRD
jgi:hypothetical protein